jgi:Spy/CpxP family protein refolding chaperone
MRTRAFVRLGAAAFVLAACSDPSSPRPEAADDSVVQLQQLAATDAAARDGNWGGVLTPAVRRCGPDGPPRLTDEQVEQIRKLKAAFHAAMQDEIELIRSVLAKAKAAQASGASAARVRAILAEAQPAIQTLREAEQRLLQAILGILTPDQRRRWCHVGGPFFGTTG